MMEPITEDLYAIVTPAGVHQHMIEVKECENGAIVTAPTSPCGAWSTLALGYEEYTYKLEKVLYAGDRAVVIIKRIKREEKP
jgi:hypothetical protein